MEHFILRAEVQTDRERIVTSGYLTPNAVFVVTDWNAPVGTPVVVRLAFPRVLEPVDVAAHVSEHRAAGNPGDLGGVVLAFDPAAPCAALDAFLAEAEVARQAPSVRAAYRVLLVEDNGLTSDVLAHRASRYFTPPGAIVIDHAETAERAWERLATATYDAIIVDYFLPTADGASLIAQLRADLRLRGIPIVAISMGGQAAREATLSAGADLFVDKPLVFRDLFQTLQILAHVPAEQPVQPQRTILVLDDSALALDVARTALEAAGFAVVTAVDLTAFERQRAACTPDLILVDVQMPEVYGDDIASTLLGTKRVDVPIVLFSSIDETELARRSEEAQATGYICKGAGTTELVRRCRELLEPVA